MDFLKFILTCFAFQTLLTAECCLNRNVNKNGLFEPKIDRTFLPDGKILDLTKPTIPRIQTVPGEEIEMSNLMPKDLGEIPFVTYFNPQFNFGSTFKPQYNFKLNKFKPAKGNQVIYAVELESDVSTSSRSYLDTHAYWCPQGKFVDIPIHPKINDAKYLFTPSFSGCTLVVDLMEKPGSKEKFYRVYHVQGGKEEAEYNSLRDHGLGMVTSMEYRHYGYFRPDVHNLNLHINNVIGSAFMAYVDAQKKWILFHQSQFGPYGYLVVSKIASKNGKKEITASIPQDTYVAKTNILSVRSPLGETADCGLASLHSGKTSAPVNVGLALNDYVCDEQNEMTEGKIVVYFRCRKIF